MAQGTTLVNRIEKSGIITIDLGSLLSSNEVVAFDLSSFLVDGKILMEKSFRNSLKTISWQSHENKVVAVYCSADALIPMWAYMLVVSYLEPIAKNVEYGSVNQVKTQMLKSAIEKIDANVYLNAKVVVKGCGGEVVSEDGFVEITKKLRPVVKSLMYGEPCSAVPVYKKAK